METCTDPGTGESPNGPRSAKSPRIERSAGGVVVRTVAGSWHALLIRDPYGNWSLPKGHIEGGESLREAALREVEEETAIRPEVVGPRIDTVDWVFRKGERTIHKYCTFFLMRSRNGKAAPQFDEGITQCIWLPVRDAASRIRYQGTREIVLRAEDMIVEVGW